MSEVIASQLPEIECVNNVTLVGSVVHKYRPRPDVIILTSQYHQAGCRAFIPRDTFALFERAIRTFGVHAANERW